MRMVKIQIEIFSLRYWELKLSLILVMAASWAYMAAPAWLNPAPIGEICSMSHRTGWSTADFWGTFVMWVGMMIAMMTPIVFPWLLALFRQASDVRAASGLAELAGVFALGYFVAWAGFSALATLLQWQLSRLGILSPSLVIESQLVRGLLLLATGAYQLSPLKDSCLKHCESPFAFFIARWRDGKWGGFVMGAHHGLYCVGCCWLLMAFMFVVGAMSLAWMAAVTLYVLLEMYVPQLRWLSRATGWLLLVGGAEFLIFA